MDLLLISGHGASDPGAQSNIAGYYYSEAEEARRVTSALQATLRDTINVDIYPTERNAYDDVINGTSGYYADFSKYDYVLEVHFNAFRPVVVDNVTKGVECYIPTIEPGDTVEQLICKNVSDIGMTNRGVKRFDWAVINHVRSLGISAALLEVCFIDDPDDMQVYGNNFDQIINAIANGVLEGFNVETIKMDDEEGEDEMVIYKTLNDIPAWAMPTVEKLMKKGYLQGVGEGVLNLEHNMLRTLIINDRAGLYD